MNSEPPDYRRFKKHLDSTPPGSSKITLRFSEIEGILGGPLPPSARKHTAWWSNHPSHPLMRECLAAGWRQVRLDFAAETVSFARGPPGNSIRATPPSREVLQLPLEVSSLKSGVIPPLTDLARSIQSQTWEDFRRIVHARVGRFASTPYDYSISEANFQLDFAVALALRLDYPNKVFAEYPCDLAPNQKLDLFVDDGPGLCFEFKFFRQIPSQYNPPMTQNLGALMADMIKLNTLCKPHRLKFLVVVADEVFKRYFEGQKAFPMHKGNVKEESFHIDSAQKTVRDTLAKRLPNIVLPDQIAMHLETLCAATEGSFNCYLLRIV